MSYPYIDDANLVTVMIVSILGMFVQQGARKGERFAEQVAKPIERIVGEGHILFLVVDSLALGLWAHLRTLYALVSGVPAILAPVLGVITAIFGGVLRDAFFARVPQQFLPGQPYATAAAIGAAIYALLYSLGLGGPAGLLACTAVTFAIRIASVKYDLKIS